jgi:FlaA1/EpsC-like NDP-sugar epimerase
MTFNAPLLIFFDVVLAVAAFLSATMIRFDYADTSHNLVTFDTFFSTFIFVIVLLFSSHLMEVYDPAKNVKKRQIIINIVFGAITSFALLSVVYYLNPEVMLGRGVLILSLTIFILLQFCWHALYLVGKNSPRFSQNVLVLGTGALAAQMGEMISACKSSFRLVGYASCPVCSRQNTLESAEPDVPIEAILGNCNDLRDIALGVKAEVIVVALSERRGVFPLRDVLSCKLNNIQIFDAPSFYEIIQNKLMLEHITPSWFIFSSGFNRTNFFSICKRLVDIVLSCIGLLLTLPFFR